MSFGSLPHAVISAFADKNTLSLVELGEVLQTDPDDLLKWCAENVLRGSGNPIQFSFKQVDEFWNFLQTIGDALSKKARYPRRGTPPPHIGLATFQRFTRTLVFYEIGKRDPRAPDISDGYIFAHVTSLQFAKKLAHEAATDTGEASLVFQIRTASPLRLNGPTPKRELVHTAQPLRIIAGGGI